MLESNKYIYSQAFHRTIREHHYPKCCYYASLTRLAVLCRGLSIYALFIPVLEDHFVENDVDRSFVLRILVYQLERYRGVY